MLRAAVVAMHRGDVAMELTKSDVPYLVRQTLGVVLIKYAVRVRVYVQPKFVEIARHRMPGALHEESVNVPALQEKL